MRKNFDELGLLLVSLIFGFAYSFQSMGAENVEPFSFNVIKNIIGTLCIAPLCLKKTDTDHKMEFKLGVAIAVILTIFSYLQQVVALDTAPGKIGFITSLYIVEVPIINFIFFKKKINLQTLLSLVFALAGLFLLCDLRDFSFRLSDLLIIICSLCLATQITILGKYSMNCDPFKLNFFNFLFITIFSILGAILTGETINVEGYKLAIIPLLYVGVACSFIGCTMQTYCQKTVNATTASLILSLESVFSVLAGYIMLDQVPSKIEVIGSILMFIGIILCVTAEQGNKKKN